MRAKPGLGFPAALAVLLFGTLVGFEPVRASPKTAQTDPILSAAIDLYGDYAAALGISEYCPNTFNKTDAAFIKSRVKEYVKAINTMSAKHGIGGKEISVRLNALGQNNLRMVRQEVSSKGCSSNKIRRTIETIRKLQRKN